MSEKLRMKQKNDWIRFSAACSAVFFYQFGSGESDSPRSDLAYPSPILGEKMIENYFLQKLFSKQYFI